MGEAFVPGEVVRAPSVGVPDVLRRKENTWNCCVDDSERRMVRWNPLAEAVEYISL